MLLVAGDITDYGLPEEARIVARELTALRVPIVAVLGNHDYESGKEDEVRQILVDAGVVVLDGDACEINGIGIAGREGFWRRLRPACVGAVGRGHHQTVRPRGGGRSAEARSGACPVADRAPRRAAALLAGAADRRKASRSRFFPSSDRAGSRSRSTGIRFRSCCTGTRTADSSRGRPRAACLSITCRCRCWRGRFPTGRRSACSRFPSRRNSRSIAPPSAPTASPADPDAGASNLSPAIGARAADGRSRKRKLMETARSGRH